MTGMMHKTKRERLDGLVQIFTDQAVTTTASYTSSVVNAKGYDRRTLLLVSTLDQAVTATPQGARNADFANPVTLGDAVAVAQGSSVYAERDQYFPFIRVLAQAGEAPTTGSLNGWVMLKV